MAEPNRAPDGEFYCADCLIENVGRGPWNVAVTLFEGSTLCARHVRQRAETRTA